MSNTKDLSLFGSELTVGADDITLGKNVVTPEFNINAFAKDIADTAVDVFVYDTNKDSDGGAWRHRTQHTSWYNETLNTATRGSRKEFPSVAIIVVETDTVTIYDGDDPDLPMWMVFTADNYTYIAPPNRTTSSVAMLNGILCIGRKDSVGFMSYVSFVDDSARAYSSNASEYRDWLKPISDRNTTDALVESNSAYAIVNDQVNDVAMTVLPNAPIDSATGLPIPTIAVATDGGVSVIKDDGTVVDSLATQSPQVVAFVDKKLIYQMSISNGNRKTYVLDEIPTADGFGGDRIYGDGGTIVTPDGLTIQSNCYTAIAKSEGGFVGAGYTQYPIAGSIGASVVYENKESPTEGMFTQITSDYNTGWMNGDIKLATLSDTDATNVTGANLITNGDFASDTTGWSSGSASTLSVVSGELVITSTGGDYPSAKQDITVVANQPYYFSCDIKKGTTSTEVHLEYNDNGGSGWQQLAVNTTTTMNTYTGTIVPSTTTVDLRITIFAAGIPSGETAIADNIILQLAENDRSVNGGGYQGKAVGVFGTVTKSVVATGADLVAYSGWSGTNYLFQPYNSDFAVGTGDVCAILWWNANTLSGTTRWMLDQGGNGLELAISTTTVFYNCASTQVQVTYAQTGNWNCSVLVRQSGVLSAYLNGEFKGSIGSSSSVTAANGTWFGSQGSNLSVRPFDGKLALLRISTTAPSPEQIAKIYEDEKVLFQENAQATLYGTSDAVTALAYDETTKLLHVGTSDGRSVFQGLRRVDNTTDSVGVAISAHNGLVAEE